MKVFCDKTEEIIAEMRDKHNKDIATMAYYFWKKNAHCNILSWDGMYLATLRNPKNNWCPWAMTDKDKMEYWSNK